MRRLLFALAVCAAVQAAEAPPVSSAALQAHVRFLASDLLEGRGTPSRGLDIAAEYIAAQFRRIGLEEPAADGYFQTGTLKDGGKARNVIGVLRGSDAKLRNSYVLVTSHYDHLGMKAPGEGDLIYNGANDDASGTASVIEIASAIASLKTRPKRSIVFLVLYGEEEGLYGSKFYVKHPVVPLKDTVADINLEQMGRTDDPAGPQIRNAKVTGFEYTNIGAILQAAGGQTGIAVRADGRNDTFNRSDNISFAKHGIPSHTVGVAWEFPDYHAVSDEWPKLDYENMAAVDRMIATAVLMIADDTHAPFWNREAADAQEYAERR